MNQLKLQFLAAMLLATNVVAADRPNVIYILTDDWGYGDYGVFFQNARASAADRSEPWHFTPHLDTMANEGLQLRQHYCAAPVCAPSRASLLLGVHQGHSNVRDNQFDKALGDNHTLGSVMRDAGYATAAIGKWGLQGEKESNNEGHKSKDPKQKKKKKKKKGQPNKKPAKPSGPDNWAGYPTKRGFDYFYGYVRHRDGHKHYPKEDGKQVWENGREVSADLAGCYTTDLFTARAKRWVQDQHSADSEKPFFLYLAYDTPHATLQLPPTKYPAGQGVSGGLQWLGKPGEMINTASGTVDSYVHPDYANQTWDHDKDPATAEKAWPKVYKRYASGVRRIDFCVGDLLQLLDDLGIGENTLVVFTTDNGPSNESYLKESYRPNFFNSFGPFDGIKRDVWEGGTRIGALVRWPTKIAAGRVSNFPCQAHDWMSTMAQLAGIPSPARCDGVSLLPTLTGTGPQPSSSVYVEYANDGQTPNYLEFEPSRRKHTRKQMQAIRDGDYMGVRYDIQSHDDPFEIYNVMLDPKQTKDLAPQQPGLQKSMHDAVLRLRRPNSSAKRPYDDELIPGVASVASQVGVQWRSYSTTAPWLAKLDKLTPISTGQSPTIESIPVDANQQLLVNGFLEIPMDGVYTFRFSPDSNALLRIHDAIVIDASFHQSKKEKSGAISLQAGRHPFRLYWKPGSAKLGVQASGPSMPIQALPAQMLRHRDLVDGK